MENGIVERSGVGGEPDIVCDLQELRQVNLRFLRPTRGPVQRIETAARLLAPARADQGPAEMLQRRTEGGVQLNDAAQDCDGAVTPPARERTSVKQLVAIEQRDVGVTGSLPQRLLVERQPLVTARRELRLDQEPVLGRQVRASGPIEREEAGRERTAWTQRHPATDVCQPPHGKDEGRVYGQGVLVMPLGGEPGVPLRRCLTGEKVRE